MFTVADTHETRIRKVLNEIVSTTRTHNRPCIQFIERVGVNKLDYKQLYILSTKYGNQKVGNNNAINRYTKFGTSHQKGSCVDKKVFTLRQIYSW